MFWHYLHVICPNESHAWEHLLAGVATPFEKRLCSGIFAVGPFMVTGLAYVGPDSAWFPLFFACYILVNYCWMRFVPAIASWLLGTVFWLVTILWALWPRL